MTKVKVIKGKKMRSNQFIGKPIFNAGSNGFIVRRGIKSVKNRKTGISVSTNGYYFWFWGSKSQRFIPLKTIQFLSLNFFIKNNL